MRIPLLITGMLLPLFLLSQQVQKHINYAGEKIGFYEYKPEDYQSNKKEKYPLIIFLHGIGERGNGTSELWKVKRIAIPAYIDRGEKMRFYKNGKWHTFIVLSPQCPKKYGMWPTSYVDAMIDYAEKNLRIDKSRIYLTGLSMGGGGTWKFVSASPRNAKKLAAIATVCAPSTLSNACNVASNKLPMWSFHATNDRIVNVSVIHNAINKVLKCRPAIKPIKTVWNSGGHEIWDKAYDTKHRFQTPNVFEWFLGYSRNGNTGDDEEPKPSPVPGKNTPPVAIAGEDKVIHLPYNSTVLRGTRSRDKDGWIKAFRWTKLSGPSCRIANPNAGDTKVYQLVAGTYVFRLAVTDGKGATSYDVVKVKVNTPPVIVSTGNKTVYLPYNSVSLQAYATYDPDPNGWIQSFQWKKIGGPSKYRIVDPKSGTARITGLVKGVYMFRFTATDGAGASSYKDIVVHVKNSPSRYSNHSTLENELAALTEDSVAAISAAPSRVEESLSVYPNPATSFVNISFNNENRGRTAITVIDISGRIVKTEMVNKDSESFRKNVDISMLNKGVYVLTVAVEGKPAISKRFLKE